MTTAARLMGRRGQRKRDVVLPDGTTYAARTPPLSAVRAALIVAKWTGHRVGVDTATRMAKDADFS